MEHRFSLLGIIHALMISDNMGDVADEIDHLHDLVGFSRPRGGFEEGWHETDLLRLED